MTLIDTGPTGSVFPAAETRAAPWRLTPGQWRRILEDPSFLADADNRYQRPRRLHGRPVEIVR